MTWLVWRQHRYEILGLLVGGLLIAAALVYGADIATRVRAELGVDTCQPLPNTNANCFNAAAQAADRLQPFRWLVILLFFLPAVAGSFVGGPLFARDLERGTHRLVWTQGITRLRWATAKLVGLLLVGTLAAIAVALFGGRASAINGSGIGASAFQNFDLEGPAFVSYVIFAIAVAALAGTLSRRILVGMFVGLLAFGVVRVGVEFTLRPGYEAPVTVVRSSGNAFPQTAVPAGAWLVGTDFLDPEGRVVPQERVRALLDSYRPTAAPYEPLSYMANNGANQRIQFHPADRYWRFQWTESLIFLALTAGLGAATLLLLDRRDA